MATDVLMIHYNDVYNVEPLAFKGPKDLAAGATRFAGKVKSFAAEEPLIVFSGDAFNPSSSECAARDGVECAQRQAGREGLRGGACGGAGAVEATRMGAHPPGATRRPGSHRQLSLTHRGRPSTAPAARRARRAAWQATPFGMASTSAARAGAAESGARRGGNATEEPRGTTSHALCRREQPLLRRAAARGGGEAQWLAAAVHHGRARPTSVQERSCAAPGFGAHFTFSLPSPRPRPSSSFPHPPQCPPSPRAPTCPPS
jgi:hypothetical protein